MAKKALIAVGGNSLIRAGERGTIEEQFGNARATAKTICKMVQMGWQVVVTHGNGLRQVQHFFVAKELRVKFILIHWICA